MWGCVLIIFILKLSQIDYNRPESMSVWLESLVFLCVTYFPEACITKDAAQPDRVWVRLWHQLMAHIWSRSNGCDRKVSLELTPSHNSQLSLWKEFQENNLTELADFRLSVDCEKSIET
jgi:hypothetical protein